MQEIFYRCKNETMDVLTDEELLECMKAAFDGECEGPLEFMEETAMDEIARAVRRGDEAFWERYGRMREEAYQYGYEKTVHKVKLVQQIYNQMIAD